MGYQVKWIEEHLGITRKAIRNYEDKGLLPKNQDGKYREFSDKEIDYLWTLKLLQGIGYSVKEIKSIQEHGEEAFDFRASISEKIKQLKKRKMELEKSIGYAQAIKSSGRMPYGPKEMGAMTVQDFHEKALNEWNIADDPFLQVFQQIVDLIEKPEEAEWAEEDLPRFFSVILRSVMESKEEMVFQEIIQEELVKKMAFGPDHTEVQLLIGLLYKYRIRHDSACEKMTTQQFARFSVSSILCGDSAVIYEKQYGKEACVFLADAFAIFGGYASSNELE